METDHVLDRAGLPAEALDRLRNLPLRQLVELTRGGLSPERLVAFGLRDAG